MPIFGDRFARRNRCEPPPELLRLRFIQALFTFFQNQTLRRANGEPVNCHLRLLFLCPRDSASSRSLVLPLALCWSKTSLASAKLASHQHPFNQDVPRDTQSQPVLLSPCAYLSNSRSRPRSEVQWRRQGREGRRLISIDLDP